VPKEPKQPTGWLARWRERRREKALRAADMTRRKRESQRGDLERDAKYGGGRQ
jgi:hypothetical protein